MKLTNPYKLVEKDETITLLPKNLNNDIEKNIIDELKLKIDNRCIQENFIKTIVEVIDPDNCNIYINNEDLIGGTMNVNVRYKCISCIPLIGDFIVVTIKKNIKKLLLAESDPMRVIVNLVANNINKDNFHINDNMEVVHTKTKKSLQNNDKIIVKVINTKFPQGEDYIYLYCYLYDTVNDNNISLVKDNLEEIHEFLS